MKSVIYWFINQMRLTYLIFWIRGIIYLILFNLFNVEFTIEKIISLEYDLIYTNYNDTKYYIFIKETLKYNVNLNFINHIINVFK